MHGQYKKHKSEQLMISPSGRYRITSTQIGEGKNTLTSDIGSEN